MDIKRDFRRKFIEKKNQISTEEVIKKSAEIFNRVCSLKEYERASVVMAYMSFGMKS
jgi:5-formyltetrahydrofolate cyclo-ligase